MSNDRELLELAAKAIGVRIAQGSRRCVADWCKELDLNPFSVYGRIRHAGATPADALEWAIGRAK